MTTLAPIVVGVDGSESALDAVRWAAREAVLRGGPKAGQLPLDGPVVVGVDGTENSESAIAEAFETASLHGVDVVAVHAWNDYDLATAFRSDPDGVALGWDAIESAEHAVLAESLAGWQEKYPD